MENEIKTLNELLQYSAKRFGDKASIRYAQNGNVIDKTFYDLYNDSLLVAKHLAAAVPFRSHIAITGKTCYEYLVCFNAVFMSGNTAVPLSPEFPADELIRLCNRADVSAVIYDHYTNSDFISSLKKQNVVLFPVENALLSLPEAELPEIDPDACAMIMFTSGTTGEKKGVMLSSRAIISNVLFKEMAFEGDHVALNVLPIYHIFSFSCDYLKNIKDGVTICLNGDAGNIGTNLLLYEPTVIRLVPMIIDSLLRKARIIRKKHPDLSPREAAEKVFGKRLRSIIASGAYLNADMAAEYEEMGISIRQGYGMTETGPRIAVPNGKTSIYSAGAVIDICEVRIKDGEIQVKSPSLLIGYYKDEAATKAAFTDDGWFMTGDMGYLAPDKQLYITGRKKNLIILSNGENISPEELEKKIYNNTAIAEVLVYGEKDKIAAEIYISREYLNEHSEQEAQEKIRLFIQDLNAASVSEKEVSILKFRNIPFEKTSSGKIKRPEIKFKEK